VIKVQYDKNYIILNVDKYISGIGSVMLGWTLKKPHSGLTNSFTMAQKNHFEEGRDEFRMPVFGSLA
jgi:hypothetical protein